MDFTSFLPGSIDYSPFHITKSHTIVLCEEELAHTSTRQIERFIRVWHTERSMYAPPLDVLTIVMRPSFRNNTIAADGIHTFMRCLNSMYGEEKQRSLEIYMDNWSLDGMAEHKVADAPYIMYSKLGHWYADDQLNQLMKKYKENEQKRDELYAEQKINRMGNAKVRGATTVEPMAGSGVVS